MTPEERLDHSLPRFDGFPYIYLDAARPGPLPCPVAPGGLPRLRSNGNRPKA